MPELRSSDLRLRLRTSLAFMGRASPGIVVPGRFGGRFLGGIHRNVTGKPLSRRAYTRFGNGSATLGFTMQQILAGHLLSRRAWRRPRRRERLARKLESLVVTLLEGRAAAPAPRSLGNC